MKKIFLILFLIFILSTLSYSQLSKTAGRSLIVGETDWIIESETYILTSPANIINYKNQIVFNYVGSLDGDIAGGKKYGNINFAIGDSVVLALFIGDIPLMRTYFGIPNTDSFGNHYDPASSFLFNGVYLFSSGTNAPTIRVGTILGLDFNSFDAGIGLFFSNVQKNGSEFKRIFDIPFSIKINTGDVIDFDIDASISTALTKGPIFDFGKEIYASFGTLMGININSQNRLLTRMNIRFDKYGDVSPRNLQSLIVKSGVGYNYIPIENFLVYTGIYFRFAIMEFDADTSTRTEYALPIIIGAEFTPIDWITLRASMAQNIINYITTAGTSTDYRSNTLMSLGVTLDFDRIMLDWFMNLNVLTRGPLYTAINNIATSVSLTVRFGDDEENDKNENKNNLF